MSEKIPNIETDAAANGSFSRRAGSPHWVWSERNQCWNLKDGDHSHATVWPNGTWHTWDNDGAGGENGFCLHAPYMPFENRHFTAKREAWEACERQGFIAENVSHQPRLTGGKELAE